ncbi:L-fuco-beta-pyranose dehydrogenase [[Actinomadura] parvosata subsp. kistnae]|nr:L-fuco-beta-pyranose dehydrogenase [Actinomadura parvosata subsp. kistnae]
MSVALPRLGLGTAPIGNLFAQVSERDAAATVAAAVAEGMTYFDTAPRYGHGVAEDRLGRALAEGTAGGAAAARRAARWVARQVARLLKRWSRRRPGGCCGPGSGWSPTGASAACASRWSRACAGCAVRRWTCCSCTTRTTSARRSGAPAIQRRAGSARRGWRGRSASG